MGFRHQTGHQGIRDVLPPASQVFLTTVLSLSEQIEGHQATNPALQVLPGCLACGNALLSSTDSGVLRGQGATLISF